MRSRRRLIGCVVVAGLLLTLSTATTAHTEPDEGEGSGWVWIDEDEGAVDVGAEWEAGGGTVDPATDGGSSGHGSGPVCTWDQAPGEYLGREMGPYVPPELRDHVWYFRECTNPDGSTTSELVPVDPGAAGAVTAEILRDEATDRLSLPRPGIGVNPGEPVVHVETWLWVRSSDWTVQVESASAAGVTSTVTARPSRVLWEMGNGDTVVCTGAGTAYEPDRPAEEQTTDCSYTYRHSSAGQPDDAYVLTATIEWELEWSVVGAAGGGPLPVVTTTDTTPLRVRELQALNE